MNRHHIVAVLGILAFVLYPHRATASSAERHELGNPIIRNYTSEEYGGEIQIWSIVQDRRGVMYFGGYRNIIEFDGQAWRLIPVPRPVPRGMTIDDQGTIYVGLVGDLGYLASDASGKLGYVSLLDKLPEKQRDFGPIRYIFATSHGVYFVAINKLLRYYQGGLEVIEVPSLGGYLVDDSVYLISRDSQISVVTEGTVYPLGFFDAANKEDTSVDPGDIAVLPLQGGKALIATKNRGLFVHHLTEFIKASSAQAAADPTSFLVTLPAEVNTYIGVHGIYRGHKLSDTRFALGTKSGGIVIIDDRGKIVRIINKNHGLVNDSLIALFADRFGNLWAGTQNGISHILLSSPMSTFNERNSLESSLHVITRHDETLYLATANGIYYLPPYVFGTKDGRHDLKKLNNTNNYVFAMISLGETLLAVMQTNVIAVSGDTSRTLLPLDITGHTFVRSKRFPDILFLGGKEGITALDVGALPRHTEQSFAQPDNAQSISLIPNETLRKFAFEIYQIAVDDLGDLWASSLASGIYHIRWRSDDHKDVEIIQYGVEDGLPELANNYAYYVDGRILVGNKKGLYQFVAADDGSGKKGRFVPEPTFGRMFCDKETYVWQIKKDYSGNIWIANPGQVGVMRKDKEGNHVWDTGITSLIRSNFRSFYAEKNGIIWLGTTEELYRYDSTKKKDYGQAYDALIRRVVAAGENVLLDGGYVDQASETDGRFTRPTLDQPKAAIPALAYENNTISIHYAATFYELPEKTSFKFQLVGFDKDWSAWVETSFKEYTNIPEGDYVFKVVAKNIYGTESKPATFAFRVLSPWYRTGLAYAGYIAAFLILFVGGVRLYTWRLIVSRRKLQTVVKQKTAEVVEQKEDIIRQKEEIERANEALWGEMALAKKIQTVLLPEKPELPGYRIAAYTEPADEVGGDYYDVLNVGNTNWVIIGDVSGHGVPAGLVMMMVQTSIRSVLECYKDDPPEKILEIVNRVIFENIKKLGDTKYMTLTLLSCRQDGAFYFSGLHQDIFVYRACDGEIERVETNGMWIGITADINGMLEVEKLTLNPGDAMLLYTDGITEATGADGQMFSGEQLASQFKMLANKPVEEIQRGILRAIDGYTSDDDITFLILKRVQSNSDHLIP